MTATRSPDLGALESALTGVRPFELSGRVAQVMGLAIEAQGPPATIGEICRVERAAGRAAITVAGG